MLSSKVALSFSDYIRYLDRFYELPLPDESFQGLAADTHYMESSRSLGVLFSLQISLAPQAYGLLIFDQETLQKNVAEWMGDGQLTISSVETVFLHLINEEDAAGWNFEKNSEYTDFTYYGSFPMKADIPLYTQLLTLGGVLLLLGVGSALAYLLACITYKPLYALFHDNIFVKDSEANEYQSIQMLLNDTMAENILMRQDTEATLPILHDETLRNLLKGFFSSQDEIQRQMSQYHIPFQPDCFFSVLIIKVPRLPDSIPPDTARKEIAAFCETLPYAAQWLETIAGEYIVILGMEDARHDAGIVGSRLRQHLSSRLEAPVLLFRGDTQQGAIGISVSFQAAKAAMFNGDATAKADSALKNFYFPFDWEQQLTGAIAKGEEAIVRRILYQMLLENQKKDLLEEYSDEVIHGIFRLVEQILSENGLPLPPGHQTKREQLRSMEGEKRWLELVEYAAAAARLCAEQDSPSRKVSLKGYVDDHYCSSRLSLKDLCQYSGMSESMVSKAFKAEVGENFYQYLTNKRMAKAKELLLSRCYDVQTIAAMTGYESRNSFTRAFIRSEGVKPSEFVTYGED